MEIDLAIRDDGTLLDKEVEMALSSAPRPVRDAVAVQRKGTNLVLEEFIRSSDAGGNVQHYRAWLRDGSREVKLRIAPDGTLLQRRERIED